MKDTQHRERHLPLIEEVRQDCMDLYVGMLHDLNASIANIMRRARGIEKGHAFYVIQGGKSPGGLDLFKAAKGGKRNYKNNPNYRYDHGKHRWVRATAEEKKERTKQIKAEGGEVVDEIYGDDKDADSHEHTPEVVNQGAWFADENGNVRYALKPSARYKRQLDEEEAKNLYQNLNVVVNDVMGTRADALAKVAGVDIGVVKSLQGAVSLAQSRGLSVEEVFIKDLTEGLDDEDDEEGLGQVTAERAHELYSNVLEAFKEATESDDWKKYSKKLLERQKEAAIAAAELAERNQKIVKGFFNDIVTGDTNAQSVKMLGLMHSFGMFSVLDIAEAKKYCQTEEEAYKMVGKARTNNDRLHVVAKLAPTLGLDQQVAIASAIMIGTVDDALAEDALFDADEFWQEEHPELDALRTWAKNSGKEFTDDEWELAKGRITETAKTVSNMMRAYNETPATGVVFRALAHGQTSMKELFKNPKELERLQALHAELQAKMDRALDAQKRSDFEIDPIVIKSLQDEAAARAIKEGKDPDEARKNAGLFTFQRSAVGWMEAIDGGILAFGAGTGKTPIAATYISNLLMRGEEKRGIITVPTTLVDQWASEITRFRPGSKVLTVTGSNEERRMLLEAVNAGHIQADYVIMPDSTLGSLSKESQEELNELIAEKRRENPKKGIGPVETAAILRDSGILERDPLVKALREMEGAAIFDEAHMWGLKEATNTKHLIAKEMVKDRKRKFGMTATPVVKGPEDLFTLMNLFNPGSAGEDLSGFVNRFVKFDKSEDVDPETGKMVKRFDVAASDAKDLEAAKKSIAPFVYFKSKIEDDVTKEMESKGNPLPKVNAVSHPLSMPQEALDFYNAAAEQGYDEKYEPYGGRTAGQRTDAQLVSDMMGRGMSERTILRALKTRGYNRQLMCSISPKLINKDYKGPQPKIDATCEIVQRHFAEPGNADKPVIIFGSFKNSLALQKEELIKRGIPEHLIAVYTGDTEKEDRTAIQNAVNAGKIKVALIGIQAGGTGLNLQKAANRMVFLDKPWTPAQVEQSVGRVWRTGNRQDRVHVHHMAIAGTTDDNKREKLGNRLSFADALSVADRGEEAISSKIMASMKVLVGDFDGDVQEWTPEQKKEILTTAGLSPNDQLPAFMQMSALKQEVDFQKFRDDVEKTAFKNFGDVRVGRMSALNDAYYRSGEKTKDEWLKGKKKAAKMAQAWKEVVDKSQHQYVAQYLEGFDFKSGDTGTVPGNQSKGIKDRKKQTNTVPPKTKPFPLASAKGSLKLHEKSKFNLKNVSTNPFKKNDPQWAFWEALRRTKPSGYEDAVKKVANWMYEDYKNSDQPMTRKYAQEAVNKWFGKKKILHKFAKMKLIEVTE